MKPEVYKKHSDEVRILEIDCSPSVPSGSAIAQVNVNVTDDTEVDGDSLIASYTGKSELGNKIYVQISSGEDKCSYNLEVKLSLSNGEIIIDNLRIDVSDSDTIP